MKHHTIAALTAAVALGALGGCQTTPEQAEAWRNAAQGFSRGYLNARQPVYRPAYRQPVRCQTMRVAGGHLQTICN